MGDAEAECLHARLAFLYDVPPGRAFWTRHLLERRSDVRRLDRLVVWYNDLVVFCTLAMTMKSAFLQSENNQCLNPKTLAPETLSSECLKTKSRKALMFKLLNPLQQNPTPETLIAKTLN